MSVSPAPVCVVVTNHNGREHLIQCLDSVLALEGAVERVLVVDNDSQDGSLELIARRYPGVEVLAREKNDGPAGARNAGLARVESEWVLLLDNDVVLEPDTLERLLAAATSRPDVALVQPRSVFDTDHARVHYDGGAPHYLGLVALRNFYATLERASTGGVVEVGAVISLALLVHRRSVLDCGAFDPDYFILFEDLDLSYRLRLEGKSLLLDETTVVRHRGGTPELSFRDGDDYPAQRIFLHSRNRWLFLARNLRARTLLVSLPGLLLYEASAPGGAASATSCVSGIPHACAGIRSPPAASCRIAGCWWAAPWKSRRIWPAASGQSCTGTSICSCVSGGPWRGPSPADPKAQCRPGRMPRIGAGSESRISLGSLGAGLFPRFEACAFCSSAMATRRVAARGLRTTPRISPGA
jgi:GT2 family glycosyltransferase